MKLEFAQNDAYVRFEQWLRELHQLIAGGEGDSENADILREKMSAAHCLLSEQEIERVKGLSEDLYSLTETRATTPVEHSPIDAEVAKAFFLARQRENWPDVLHSLRQLARRSPASDLAFQRYQAYAHLGHLETAYLFLQRASKLDPTNLRKQHLLLDFSRKAGRGVEALAEAERLLRDSTTKAPLVIAAAHILFDALGNISTDAALPAIREIEIALERAMRDPNGLKDSPVSVSIVGHTTLGFCRDKLGDIDGAMKAFDQALKLDPKSDSLRVARGLVLAPHDRLRAAAEFKEAADSGSRLFHPYLFLAPHALSQGKWAEAREYAKRLFDYGQSPEIVAEAQQWRAIAEFELNRSSPHVESLFHQAQSLDPFNVQIAENIERWKNARSSFAGRPDAIAWSRPGQTDIPIASASRITETLVPAEA
jgi:tetratricopeptide (TPR) repeat protein